MKSHVSIKDVWKSFDAGRIQVLKGVGLEVPAGDVVALCGTSGCGKSTLLNVISGLEEVDRGEVFLSGRDVVNESTRVDLLRHHIGYVFQFHHLMPDLTLAENCMVPVIAAGGSRAAALERLNELAEATGVAHRLKQRVRELSGGERQRGALVRSLMNDPELLLCDEPTGALDESNRERVFEILVDLVRRRGRTLIMATHDLELAKRCDRTIKMRDGRMEGEIL
ncbi:ABC transporter ATP-binding protein [Luteolibacter pohnpeiensis]|uniref:ABC transporter ATP-binding protein n=1 Tax=Luteolibacter pohnpeiensis TaxID=454153 RepID=A0A934VRC6_9BACT|nr:ABC transporter ATP-binding protein [Luteolibacter pohnpeiensis]MBK1883056.1 ABC transporter ATP-binding protein [Luteolibacter pohnpeiensis]